MNKPKRTYYMLVVFNKPISNHMLQQYESRLIIQNQIIYHSDQALVGMQSGVIEIKSHDIMGRLHFFEQRFMKNDYFEIIIDSGSLPGLVKSIRNFGDVSYMNFQHYLDDIVEYALNETLAKF